MPGGISTDEWTHIAVTLDPGNDTEFFVDGVSVGTLPGASPATATLNNDFTIGGGSFFQQERFVGLIDDVRVYDGVLTDEEIFNLTIPEPASIAIWSLLGLGLSGFGYWRVRRKK